MMLVMTAITLTTITVIITAKTNDIDDGYMLVMAEIMLTTITVIITATTMTSLKVTCW